MMHTEPLETYRVPASVRATIPGITVRKTAAGFFASRSAMFAEGFAGRFAPAAAWEVTATGRVSTEECIEWDGAVTKQGYGLCRTKSTGRKLLLTHRAVWEENFGTIPEGLHVCHRCDNPPCINPEHLFLGTNDDNRRDMTRKRRTLLCTGPGEKNPNARLTDPQVLAIRDRLARGGVGNRLAKEYGVSAKMIYLIRDRRAWSHI
jgi:hypothetical protein